LDAGSCVPATAKWWLQLIFFILIYKFNSPFRREPARHLPSIEVGRLQRRSGVAARTHEPTHSGASAADLSAAITTFLAVAVSTMPEERSRTFSSSLMMPARLNRMISTSVMAISICDA
jgi:hypothetical protein